MTKIYTMQNDNGDRGWIQYIENGREIDEVMGGPATMINPEFNKCYTIIDEKEYDIMIKLHELYGESQNEKYLTCCI